MALKTITLNFRSMSQRQIEAMAAGTLGEEVREQPLRDFRQNISDIDMGALNRWAEDARDRERMFEQEDRRRDFESSRSSFDDSYSSPSSYDSSSYSPSFDSGGSSGGYDF